MDNPLILPFDCLKINSSTPFYMKKGQLITIQDQFGIYLCTRGHIKISINMQQYYIKSGDIFFYSSIALIHILDVSDDLEAEAFRSNFDFMVPIANKIFDTKNLLYVLEHPCISLTEIQYKDIYQLLIYLKNRVAHEDVSIVNTQKKFILSELMKSLAETFCYEVMNIYFEKLPDEQILQDRKDIIFQNFIYSLYHHYEKEREVSFYANEQFISPSYFSNIIKEKSARTVPQWISHLVIIHAKQMLEYSNVSIKEIAIKLNFPNQSFFGRYFKKYVGLSPKEYRKKNRSNKNAKIASSPLKIEKE